MPNPIEPAPSPPFLTTQQILPMSETQPAAENPTPNAPLIIGPGTLEELLHSRKSIESELSKVIIGQKEAIDQILISLYAGGHCLITGAPGLAKTLLVKSIAQVFHLSFQRIQFTPDLMPSDITGSEILQETDAGRKLVFVKGPIFGNIVLADEINRTPPKTQSALLEAMQEKQVTAAGNRYALPNPFFVLATQNPIEMEGAYPLPEAQVDRFMFNVIMDYLPENEEMEVVRSTTSTATQKIDPLYTAEDVLKFQQLVRETLIADEILRSIVQLVAATRPKLSTAPDFVNRWVSWGAGSRAAQCLALGSKVRALLHNRAHVSLKDVRALAMPTLRHRVLLNYRAEAEGITVETVIQKLLERLG